MQLEIEHLPQLAECHYKAMGEGTKRSSLQDLTLVNLPISDKTAIQEKGINAIVQLSEQS
jgi:hypothetical protein